MVRKITKKSIQKGIEICSFCTTIKQTDIFFIMKASCLFLFYVYKLTLTDILNSLESISNRIDDIQVSLIKNNDADTSSNLDISEIDF